MKKFLFISGLVAALSFPALAAPYALDSANSKVDFSVSHLKLTQVDGKFNKFSATIDYDSASQSLKVLEGVVDIASVDTANAKRDAHLQAEDMFDAKKYPNMTFKMTKFEAGKIYGDLTIRSTTKPIVLDATIQPNGKALDINATTKILRSDFDITWGNIFKDNSVGDEVKITLSLKANAQ
ncbi:YceI family protein [Helicobacter rodentium]|uniref:YceI family protein n=1 Tax=Helicobacter rodentium TaxID=59617 RepID=UPI00047D756C|nr:YceI family protein [Helicobacter rodentium]